MQVLVFLLVFWSPKQVKNEENYEESWAKLRIQLPRVNPDCKEKKQRGSVMEHILDDSRSSPLGCLWNFADTILLLRNGSWSLPKLATDIGRYFPLDFCCLNPKILQYDAIYAENEVELTLLIQNGAVYEEKEIGQWHDQLYKCGLC